MGLMSKLFGVADEKSALIRRLLRHRIESDPAAAAVGQHGGFAETVPLLQLMGLPEATIVTCIETWAQLREQKVSDEDVARRIAGHRGIAVSTCTVQAVIRDLMKAEHAKSGFLPAEHVEWCITEAMKAYAIEVDLKPFAEVFYAEHGKFLLRLTDKYADQLQKLLERDARRVRLTLLAFCLYASGYAVANKLDSDKCWTFQELIARKATSAAGETGDQVVRMLLRRSAGFSYSMMDLISRKRSTAPANYFMACCSVDREDVSYEEICPDPDELERAISDGVVPAAARSEVSRIRSLDNPAIYSMLAEPKETLRQFLMSILQSVEATLDRIGQMSPPTPGNVG